MAVGVLAVRNLLRRRLGLVHLSAHFAALLAFPAGDETREFRATSALVRLWPIHRTGRSHRTRCALGAAVSGCMDLLPAISPWTHLVPAQFGRGSGSVRRPVTVDRSQLRELPQVHSGAQRFRS